MTIPPPNKNLYHVAGYFRTEPKLVFSFSCFYERETKMTDEEVATAFTPRAKAAFAVKGFPEVVPVLQRIGHHHDLPHPPRLPSTDQRPLLAWDIWADLVVDDVKFGSTISETFLWPEEPKGAVLNQLIFFYAACAIAGRGDHPGYANEARISGIKVTLNRKVPSPS